jgi:arginyl-tRNA synthetase
MKKRLEGLLQHALEKATKGGALKSSSLPPLFFEVPRDPQFGDLASTVALGLARQERRTPRAIAETIAAHIEDPGGILSATEIAGPGYLNFRFSPRFWRECLAQTERSDYGRVALGAGRRVLVEFVSTNPTGPLHVGHGRGAVIGDALARLLEAAGYDVLREYYVNDAGKQIATLGRSTLARLRQAFGEDRAVPEDGYPGEYLLDLAARHRDELVRDIAEALNRRPPESGREAAFLREAGESAVSVCGDRAAGWLLEIIKKDMLALGVHVDSFVSERALAAQGLVATAVEALERRDLIYEDEGARWFRSTRFGDEKDRVVLRSNGEPTYFSGDIGYHQHKLQRRFDELINVWGADHHGYVKRVEAAIEALGSEPKRLHVILVQMVRLMRGGEPLKMGKRTGEFVTLREVVDEVGADATRFFFLMRKGDSHLDFDLDLAKKQSAENPVFYVQYAHARICSLFRQAASEGLRAPAAAGAALERLDSTEEQEVIKLLARFPDVVEDATRELEPHRVVFHLIELAGSFHRFYNSHRVVGVESELSAARLYLAGATRRVLQTGLSLVGVRAPESM